MNKILVGILIGAALGAGGYWALTSGALDVPTAKTETVSRKDALKPAPPGTYCAKVITPARNPETGKIEEFPTSCSVPEGWEVIQNDVPDLDLEL